MSVVIRVEKLSKAYRLGQISQQVFWREWRQRFSGQPALAEDDPNLFWALRDLSFEVREGEVVGLLGRNGAGKSTLLKIVSQITSPTAGCVKIRGRVASLLEVGTGFHGDLTGRDNVFLNGTILGMTHREVARKFDEIVAFSGVEEFIDTPVKRYSVGMRVRLAFAVAAHLEPEILLIDEVLAVGDASFQQKCLGKIGEVSQSGRTVLFVSHSAASIEALCTRGIVLDHGRLAFAGTTADAIDFYAASRAGLSTELSTRTDRTGTGELRVTGLEVRNASGAVLASVRSAEDVEIALHFTRRTAANFPRLAVQLTVSTHVGAPVFTHSNFLEGRLFGELPSEGSLVCRIPRLPLPPGAFNLGFRVSAEAHGSRRDPIDEMEFAGTLHVESGDFFGTGKLPPLKLGVCLVAGSWRLETASPPVLATA